MQDNNMDASKKSDAAKHDLVCKGGDCNAHDSDHIRFGGKYATALAGFVAGVIVALIALYPWLAFLGQLCPVKSQ